MHQENKPDTHRTLVTEEPANRQTREKTLYWDKTPNAQHIMPANVKCQVHVEHSLLK